MLVQNGVLVVKERVLPIANMVVADVLVVKPNVLIHVYLVPDVSVAEDTHTTIVYLVALVPVVVMERVIRFADITDVWVVAALVRVDALINVATV